MRNPFSRGLMGLFASALIITAASCKKSATKDFNPVVKDTLTQNIYTIDSFASPTKGIILAAPYNNTYNLAIPTPGLLLVMDQSGNVLQKVTTPNMAFNLNRWVINGQVRYTYMMNDPNAFRSPGTATPAGYYMIADSNFNTIKQVNFTPYDELSFPANQGLDIHDMILISDSDYITLSYIDKAPTNIPARLNPSPNTTILAPVIEEIRNGQPVWIWDASNDTTFYGSSIYASLLSVDSSAPIDYMHLNSMVIDPRDNNLICSSRHQNQVIKVNRQTGAVMWRLGGVNSDFPLTPDQKFLLQHHATLTDNNETLLIFDDGDAVLRPYSRVVEFHLDEVNKVVTSFKYFNIPEPFTGFMGSVQKIGDDYFIGGGSAGYMLDVNYNTGQKVIEFPSPGWSSYRAYKYALPESQ